MSGKRVARACDRCRLKKAKCNGASPCDRCSSADLICEFIQRPRPKRVYPSGYVEMLEEQQQLLITGLRKLYSCVVDGQGWPYPPLTPDKVNGKPLIHDILKAMGVLPEAMLDPSPQDRWEMPPRPSIDHHLHRRHHLSIDTTGTSTASTMSEFGDAGEELESPTDSITSTEMTYHSTSNGEFSTQNVDPNSTVSMAFSTGLFPPQRGGGGDVPSFDTHLLPAEQQQAALAFQTLMGQPVFDMISAASDIKTDALPMNMDTDQLLGNIAWPISSSTFSDVGWLDPTATTTTTMHDPIGAGGGHDPLIVYA